MLLLSLSICCASVSANGLEEQFRSFLDGMKAKGQAVAAAPINIPEAKAASLMLRTDSLPLGQDQAVLFIADGCRSCIGLADKMRRSFGSLTVMNLSNSATAREAFAQTGAKSVPATLIGKRLLTGYDPQLVKRAIADDMQDKGNAAAREGGA